MNEVTLQPCTKAIAGEITIPGDKSISHRAVILGSMAKGTTRITNFLDSEDCKRTINAFQALGVSIDKNDTSILVESNGISTFTEPQTPLFFGNSGTTARLMLGVLAGLPFFSTVYGDPFLTKRPMDRVTIPLQRMGTIFDGREKGGYLPLSVRGGDLQGITYALPVKSAQVKSAILLAGLLAKGETTVIEETPTRNHTEQMLRAFGADITIKGNGITITSQKHLDATDVHVPGDISSASFFLVAAAIVPGSNLILRNVGLNKTRTGIIDVLKRMGANIHIQNQSTTSGEVFGDIEITYANLRSTTIEGDVIPRLIDEIPVIALLATQAEGTTIIKNAEELRVKETDRIAAIVDNLSRLGARIEATQDGMIIQGKTVLRGGKIASYHDHRIAMTNVIASLIASEPVILDDSSSIAISYPKFFEDLKLILNE
ncbi:3-phosphoshikimate 1-carboxyvinyltransferase [Virgibacillus alimentarius]|uniref:3-phosphoshikimate 1-carboxyvinyltransferase n=1 Tax=Virgibacillus alimentarius TaxID=698769 RepID=A0ABS4S4F3_9BACI|nr:MULTISPECIES: 3-phosphoshikimate 1-carboxyvinyltransferase [Virgibacillus]MBP2256375.1 3-phosphoshikimate 1-carboxyvinyltransferase [Virgibacillus alimentarius]HLR66320.1 3-phosphoshikimate 1-carboxyvinyltransferase [Virgibacillus sp.]